MRRARRPRVGLWRSCDGGFGVLGAGIEKGTWWEWMRVWWFGVNGVQFAAAFFAKAVRCVALTWVCEWTSSVFDIPPFFLIIRALVRVVNTFPIL